jgi:hypothetical protein
MPARVRRTGATIYDTEHRKLRARIARRVKEGHGSCTEPICVMPSRAIPPGTRWDLAHDRATGGYRGEAHRRCNRSEGAIFGNRIRRTQRSGWTSRDWF